MRNAHGDPQSLLVLGGSSEIAQAIVRRLVTRRCRTVVLAARAPDHLTAFADEVRRLGATDVEVIPFDATATDTHVPLVERVFDEHGDIDMVLLAFGVLGDQATFDDDPDQAAAAATTNYVGAVSSGLAVARRLRAQGHGVIAVLSSVAGVRVRKANFLYGSTKAGLDAFAIGLGDALEGSGVHVLVVRPGFVVTRMTSGMPPAPLATTPEKVADAVAGALTSGREVVWVPRALQPVFTVLRMLPRSVWRRLPM